MKVTTFFCCAVCLCFCHDTVKLKPVCFVCNCLSLKVSKQLQLKKNKPTASLIKLESNLRERGAHERCQSKDTSSNSCTSCKTSIHENHAMSVHI